MRRPVHWWCVTPSTKTASSRPPSPRWSLSPRQSGAANRAYTLVPPRLHRATTAPHRTVAKAPSPPTCRPFSVISILPGGVHVLYENPGTKKSQWQKFLRACPAWQSRHELLRECFEPDFEERQKKYNGAKCLQDFDYKRTVDPHTLELVASLGPPLARPAPHAATPRRLAGGRRCRVPRK